MRDSTRDKWIEIAPGVHHRTTSAGKNMSRMAFRISERLLLTIDGAARPETRALAQDRS